MNKVLSIEEESLSQFRNALLLAILLSASIGALSVGLIALLGFFSFQTYYLLSLFSYAFLSLFSYFLLKNHQKYYALTMYIGIFSSLILFTLMLVSVLNDALRLVWFFLVAFSAFILGNLSEIWVAHQLQAMSKKATSTEVLFWTIEKNKISILAKYIGFKKIATIKEIQFFKGNFYDSKVGVICENKLS